MPIMRHARPLHWCLALVVLAGVVLLLRAAGDPARMAAVQRQGPAAVECPTGEAGRAVAAAEPQDRRREHRPRRLGWWWRNQVEPALTVLLHLVRR